jgi:AcrR family transcriptional regulator
MPATRTARPDERASSRTRDRILAASLALFNAEGVVRVPVSRIAVEMGISQGNLHYHFRRKEEIVDRLARRYEQEIEPVLTGPAAGLASVDDLWLILHLAFEKIFEYRFLFRDIDYLVTEFPGVGASLRALTAKGIEAIKRRCTELEAAGCLRASDEEIAVLALQMVMTATCWFTFARMLPESEVVGPGRAAYQVLSLLSPFLADNERAYVDYLRRKYRA